MPCSRTHRTSCASSWPHGANARDGVYPHRDATTAYAIAVQRGYDEIVRIIEEEEQKRRDMRSGMRDAPPADDLYRAIERGDVDRVIAMLDENPALVHTRHATFDVSPLHIAARALSAHIVSALLDRGADPAVRGHHDLTPLDAAAHSWYRFDAQRFADVAALLLTRGAPMTAAARRHWGMPTGFARDTRPAPCRIPLKIPAACSGSQ